MHAWKTIHQLKSATRQHFEGPKVETIVNALAMMFIDANLGNIVQSSSLLSLKFFAS